MTQLLKNPDTAGVTPTSKNGASLLTADGAGTLATKTPHLALSHQPGHLAYSEDGGAALYDTSYVYDKGNIGFEPPSPPLNSYTPPPDRNEYSTTSFNESITNIKHATIPSTTKLKNTSL
jgi:hypothetical protein